MQSLVAAQSQAFRCVIFDLSLVSCSTVYAQIQSVSKLRRRTTIRLSMELSAEHIGVMIAGEQE
jgi:hypothetical protein